MAYYAANVVTVRGRLHAENRCAIQKEKRDEDSEVHTPWAALSRRVLKYFRWNSHKARLGYE